MRSLWHPRRALRRNVWEYTWGWIPTVAQYELHIASEKNVYTSISISIYIYTYLSLSIYMYIYTTISQTRYGMFESFSSKFRGYSPLNFEPFDGPLWVLEDLKISNLYSFAGCGSIGSDHTSSVASKVHFARHCAQCKLEAMECCRILC